MHVLVLKNDLSILKLWTFDSRLKLWGLRLWSPWHLIALTAITLVQIVQFQRFCGFLKAQKKLYQIVFSVNNLFQNVPILGRPIRAQILPFSLCTHTHIHTIR